MIQLRALGGVRIFNGSATQITLRSRKHVGLLLLLAGGGRRVYSRSRLCDLFWTTDGTRARHSLSQAVYDITQRLGPVIQRGPGEDLSIDLSLLEFDVVSFEAAVKSGNLATAVELYAGPFAENLVGAGTAEFERWLDSERTRLSRLSEIALRRHVKSCESRGQWGQMCVSALRLASLAPFDEEVHRTFMRALWLQGDAASALRHYESIVGELEGELPNGLSKEMRELAQRIKDRPHVENQPARSVDREPPFIGREREFQVLRDAVAQIGGSGTSAVVVSGEAGMGKSRLVKELSRSVLVEPVCVLMSRCYQAEEDLPYTPIVEGLMPLVKVMLGEEPEIKERFGRLAYLLPEFGSREGQEEERGSVDPAAWRRQLYEEAAGFLAQAIEREPIVWFVDDVQWIDRASGALLHYLSRRLVNRPFLLVLTIRNVRGAVELPPLPVTAPGPGTSTMNLPLRPLSEAQIRKIVDFAEPHGRKHPAADLAVRLSAGNPYYALEVLEAAAESSEWAETANDWDPLNVERLRKVLDIRVSGLGPERVRLLQSIAVLERHARPRLVAEVSGLSLRDAARMAEELYTRSLILDDGDRIAFTNDAMREYVYAQMSSLQRAAFHLSAGRALEAEMDSTPGALATHFYFGDDWPRSFGYAMEAARSAQSAAGHSEAAHFADIASMVAPGSTERRLALETRAESLFATGELADAAHCYEEILRSVRPDDPSVESEIHLRLAGAEIERCNWRGAAVALRCCASPIQSVDNKDKRLYLLAEHSTLALKHAMRTGDAESAQQATVAIEQALKGLDHLSTASNRTKLAVLTAKAVQIGVNGSSHEALDFLTRAGAFLVGADTHQTSRYYTYRGVVRAWLGNWDGAEADFRHSCAIAERAGDRVSLMTQWNNLACIALERGDWSAAEERLDRAAQAQVGFESSNDTSLPILLNRANLLFYQGYVSQAAEAYAVAAEMSTEQASSDRIMEILACLGLVGLQRRELKVADDCWRKIRELRSSSLSGLGTRERFKVAWFEAAMLPSGFEAGSLAQAAEQEKLRDLPSYMKLLWLDALLSRKTNVQPKQIRETLRGYNLLWFCHVAKRWARGAGFA